MAGTLGNVSAIHTTRDRRPHKEVMQIRNWLRGGPALEKKDWRFGIIIFMMIGVYDLAEGYIAPLRSSTQILLITGLTAVVMLVVLAETSFGSTPQTRPTAAVILASAVFIAFIIGPAIWWVQQHITGVIWAPAVALLAGTVWRHFCLRSL